MKSESDPAHEDLSAGKDKDGHEMRMSKGPRIDDDRSMWDLLWGRSADDEDTDD